MSHSKGSCRFNSKWAACETYKDWLRPFKSDSRKALCILCDKLIDLSNMGESALRSHCKSSKHVGNVDRHKRNTGSVMTSFFQPAESKMAEDDRAADDRSELTIPPPTQSQSVSQPCSTSGISSFVAKDEVTKAEILWTLKLICTHQSYKSSADSDKLLRKMFPDSPIAQKFSCGERKAAYMTVYGLGEHFAQILRKQLTGYFVVMFDESLNKKLQEKQMDLVLRFWSDELHKVETRYYTSQFLGHATSQDMVNHFTEAILDSGMKIPDLVQISMDGPNVNWKFHDLIKSKINKDYNTNIINIGSCGLHIVHNSFKAGATASGWNVGSFLSGLYYLFKDSPVRREDFKTLTGSTLMPLKFVSHRWLENVPVCDRALLIWDNLVKYVSAVKNKKLPDPKNASFETVKKCVQDQLFRAKLQFFRCVALDLKPFLEQYQTNKPMVCFLWDDLCCLIRSLMKRFIKSSSLPESDGNLVKLDINDNSIHKGHNEIDLGFSCEKAVKEAKPSDRQKLELKMESKDFLVATLTKLLAKCPVIYSLVRYVSCLNPVKMGLDKDTCIRYFKKMLHLLVSNERVKEDECDILIQQFSFFLDEVPKFGSERFKEFDKVNNRVDELLYECMSLEKDKYKCLLELVKMLLTLSHGQASVERGFSVNKEIEVENMKHETLVSHRLICDHVKSVGGILNVDLSKELIVSVRCARQKYETYLQKQREQEKTASELRKRKHLVDEVTELKKKKKKLELEIADLTSASEKLCDKAETCGKMTFLTQANSLRRTAKEKKQDLERVEAEIITKQKC